MARVTVEDCIVKIPNRFDLVMCAAQRSRQLSAGAPLLIERDNDKNPVAALREIAEGAVNAEDLREAAINSYRQNPDAEPQEEEFAQILAEESREARHNRIIPDSGSPFSSPSVEPKSARGTLKRAIGDAEEEEGWEEELSSDDLDKDFAEDRDTLDASEDEEEGLEDEGETDFDSEEMDAENRG